MSIPINTDNSVQLSYSSFPFTVADIDNYATSNYLSNVSNVLRTAINTKQDILTAATTLLGVGTSITAIDYTKVSVNKPTNFQADWNSTIINKPTIYTQSQIDTFLNAKQNNLTALTTLLGTGGSITGINYNTVINKPIYSLPLSSNATTNTISISLSDYYNITQTNGLITSSSNYTTNASNALKANIDANNTTINTAIGNTSNYASNISNVLLINTSNYASNISNVLLINTSNLLYNPNYTIERPYPSKLWNSIDVSTTSITYNGLPALKLNFTLNTTGITYGSGAYIITFSNKFIIGATEYGALPSKLFDYITNTDNANAADFLNTNIVGYNSSGDYIGERYLAETSYKGEWFFLKLPVQILLTKIAVIGNSTFVVRNPALWRIYGSNDGIVWEEIVEGRQSTRLISTDYSNNSYTINKIISTQTKLYNHIGMNINAIISGQELSFIEFQIFGKEFFYSPIYSSIIDTNTAITNTSNYSLNISNILKANIDTKEAILSFTAPLTRTTNTISINLGAYSTTGTDTNYLLKSGGTMTGLLTTPNITLGGTTGKINVYDDYHYIDFNQLTDTTTIQEYGTIKFNIGQTKTTKAYVNSTGLTATAFYGDGANITNVPYSTITGKPTNFQADWTSTIINKPSTFPVDTTIYYNKTETNNLLNAKDAILSFTSPLIRTVNTITFSESAITTLTNFYNKTEANARYLQLAGGTMSAGANIITTGNIRAGSFTAGDATYQLLIGPPTATTPASLQTIQQGVGFNQNLTLQASGGNVGIGTSTNITDKLVVNGNIKAQILNLNTLASGNNVLFIRSANTTANNAIQFQNDLNRTAYIGYGGSAFPGGGNYVNNFFIENANGAIILNSQGRTSTSTPNLQIRTDGHIETSGYIIAGTNGTSANGLRIGGFDYSNTFYMDAITIGGAAADIGFTLRNANSFRFNSLTEGTGYISIATLNTNAISLNKQTIVAGNFKVSGIANIHNGSPYAVINNFMATGSLTIGGTTADYGTATNWSSSTAGLMMECNNYTEICIHDSGSRIASPMYYDGINNTINIGRDKGWGPSSTNCRGTFSCTMLSVANSGTDYVGVQLNSSQGTFYNTPLAIMFGSFTGFHRCFTDDELFDLNNPQDFKDNYIGRIVISSGKIATDTRKVDDEEWSIKYDKEGITIEDALPIFQLARKKKDKRVLGVLGMSSRNNSRTDRLIVNSVGEGGIWICNSNGNIENGDYITSSDYLGYGEKQDEIFLCNYTVAKATMDCDFQLDSPLYNCIEMEGLRIAFIAATYHSG